MGCALSIRLGAASLLCIASASAFADELTADEKKWLRLCVEGLKSPSDRVMAGAEDGIVRLGPDALPALVPLLSILDPADDYDWAGLGRALAGLGPAASADALDAARPKWPRPAQARLATLVDELRAGKLGPRKPAVAPSPGAVAADAPAPDDANVEARVRALLAEYDGADTMSTRDPQIRAIVALGRAAVPALLRFLTESHDGPGMGASAAAHALESVVVAADIPAVAKALADGGLRAAACLKKFKTAAARDALLDVVRRGFMAYAVLEGLEPHGTDAKVQHALVDWLKSQGAAMSWDVGAVARFLAERDVRDAVPALRDLVALDGDAKPRVAAALASLGEKSGIPALISYLETEVAEHRDYERHEAGEELNRIVGEAWYVGSIEPGRGARGNFAEAGAKFRDWWTRNEGRLKFDAEARRWRVK